MSAIDVIGVIIVLSGLSCVIVAVLVWLGWMKPTKEQFSITATDTGWSDVVAAVIKTVPWVALVGIVLVYGGLRALGVTFP
jgi:hypothetical protein